MGPSPPPIRRWACEGRAPPTTPARTARQHVHVSGRGTQSSPRFWRFPTTPARIPPSTAVPVWMWAATVAGYHFHGWPKRRRSASARTVRVSLTCRSQVGSKNLLSIGRTGPKIHVGAVPAHVGAASPVAGTRGNPVARFPSGRACFRAARRLGVRE